MIRWLLFGVVVLLGTTIRGAEYHPIPTMGTGPIIGGAVNTSQAVVDTILLMGPSGSGAPYIGDFEAGWNGWVPVDYTAQTVSHWRVSTYNQQSASDYAAWCGDPDIPACGTAPDTVGGYGNDWQEQLEYSYTVPTPSLPTTVHIEADLQFDIEPAYDFAYLSCLVGNQYEFVDLGTWDGTGRVAVDDSITYLPGDYWDGTDVRLFFRFVSDGAWSDEDCSWPSVGAVQVDDIRVTLTNGSAQHVVETDFDDGTFGAWEPFLHWGAGNFGHLRNGLRDVDPCHANLSNQVTFIDDGVVVPETGGTPCINWCYGPGGYIVSTTGGLLDSRELESGVISPVMARPYGAPEGASLAFDAYIHEELDVDSPGRFVRWGVRSADTDGSAGLGAQAIEDIGFMDRNFIFYGGPEYRRFELDVSDLLQPGWDQVQVELVVFDLWWFSGWWGHDGYPAPYFDNVSVRVFPASGPRMSAHDMALATDAFPEIDSVDPADPSSLHVRFDMASDISHPSAPTIVHGDSVVISVVPRNRIAALVGSPTLHYKIERNPLFDTYRTAPTVGTVDGYPASPDWSDRFAFDLPDTGLLYPGDVLHYFITAADQIGGDVRWSILPADTTGFSRFGEPLGYDPRFVVRALPSLVDDGAGGFTAPPVLFWDDAYGQGSSEEWHASLANLGWRVGIDYDVFRTSGPEYGDGNGLGGLTDGSSLAHYGTLLYSCANLGYNTINGSLEDRSDDVGAIQAWMSMGEKNVIFAGDRLAEDLVYNNPSGVGPEFLAQVIGVDLSARELGPLLRNQSTPTVIPIESAPLVFTGSPWQMFAQCPDFGQVNAVLPGPFTATLAEYTDPSGEPGTSPYAAATLHVTAGMDRIVFLAHDFGRVRTLSNGAEAAPLARRTLLLQQVLDYFGESAGGLPATAPGQPPSAFGVRAAPNPFNPQTRVFYTVPSPGHLAIKVYDVRGALVRTLIDAKVDRDGYVDWDGTDDSGRAVGGGIYLYEARIHGAVEVGKMTLVR